MARLCRPVAYSALLAAAPDVDTDFVSMARHHDDTSRCGPPRARAAGGKIISFCVIRSICRLGEIETVHVPV